MRAGQRIAAFAVVAAAVGCASMGTPPGGQEIKTPVKLLSVNPESGATNFKGRVLELRYDRVVNDRGTGEQALEHQVLISPMDGEPRVSWGRSRFAVRPRKGWKANTTYTVTVLPGISDLRGNRDSTKHVIVFATGPAFAPGSITGNIFQWLEERGFADAWVEAITGPDSTRYVARADRNGAFTLGPLPPGSYLVRGWNDQNNNRGIDRGELWDTVRVQVSGAGTRAELLAALRDTVAPRIETLTLTDSVTLAVKFDRALDPAQQVGPSMFRVVRADSTPVPIASVVTRAEDDSAKARAERAKAAAKDTSARPPAPAPAPRPAAPGDTSKKVQPPPKPSRPAPPIEVVITLGTPLQPATTYRVTAVNVRNLAGRSSSPTRILQVPKPKPPADTTAAKKKAPADTTHRPPPVVLSGAKDPAPARQGQVRRLRLRMTGSE